MKILYFRHHFSVEKPAPIGGEDADKLLVIEEENVTEIQENRACDGIFPWCQAKQQSHANCRDERMKHKLNAHVSGVAECLVF